MTRRWILVSVAVAVMALGGCGGGDEQADARSDGPAVVDGPPVIDAAPDGRVDATPSTCPDDGVGQGNGGFVRPVAVSAAWQQTSPDVWEELGDADWSCAPRRLATTHAAGTLAGTARDFQTDNGVAAGIEVFVDGDLGSADATATAAGTGAFSVAIPAATDLAVRLSATDHIDTIHLAPTGSDLELISQGTAAALPALIGISWDHGPLVLGAVTDCAGRTVSDVVVTVSTATDCPEHATGAGTFYFNLANRLPVRNNVEAVATGNGFYLVLVPLAVAPITGQVQVWGFATGDDPATDPMRLLATRELVAAAQDTATLVGVP